MVEHGSESPEAGSSTLPLSTTGHAALTRAEIVRLCLGVFVPVYPPCPHYSNLGAFVCAVCYPENA